MTAVHVRSPDDLDPPAVLRVAAGAPITLDAGLLDRVRANRAEVLAALAAGGRPVYGVNTGMGRLAERTLTEQEQAHHQTGLLIARAVGGPPWLPAADVRAVLAVRLRTLLAEQTGVGAELCEYLAARLSGGWIPAIPRDGAGCAGEIIPLCHAFQTFLGMGTVLDGGVALAADDALEREGIPPVALGPKEGVALLQGSPVATMHAIMRGPEAGTVLGHQLSAAACTVDALGAPRAIYDPRLAAGADDVLAGVLEELRGYTADGHTSEHVQAPVSVRVAPQALAYATRALDELAASATRMLGVVTDSPAFLSGAFVSTGGYHAIELGLRMDAATAALVHLAEGSVQRLHRLLDERFTGLNPQLAVEPGPQVGLVVMHKRAAGELHALRRLAAPAALGSVDTSAGQEDLQAFAWASGEQLREAVERLLTITACELIAARQAIVLRGVPGAPRLAPVREFVADAVPLVTTDRPLGPEIQRLVAALRTHAADASR
ncbi:MAG: histidine ammonia-lyase [Pseudonocardiaceae bacterium]|nr:histidine ammonia-lyase [Pseudonocardiaceae bacterium]